MNAVNSTATERKIVVALFILVLFTFSFAQRDSKRLERLYTLKLNTKTNVATVENGTSPAQLK